MKSSILALLLAAGLLTLRQGRAPVRPLVPAFAARASSVPSGAPVTPLYAAVDSHQAAGSNSNVNGMLEPGETVQISPFWTNVTGSDQTFTGTASNLTGPAGPTYTIDDATADYGTLAGGATTDCNGATGDCYLMTVSGTRPVAHWDVTFTESLSTGGVATTWTVHVGNSFTDVPTTHPFYLYVETLFHMQVTSGCGPGLYCPATPVTRAQMAVFLLKTQHGPGYTPPPCTGEFGDVPCPSQYADWIEQLHNEGITGGCGNGNYCPDSPVTRAQMAVFLLKTEHGSSYLPPACTGIFNDVPCPSQFANWIEQLFNEGITGGCGNNDYCPDASVLRGQMAVFLVKLFGAPAAPFPTPTPIPPTDTATMTADADSDAHPYAHDHATPSNTLTPSRRSLRVPLAPRPSLRQPRGPRPSTNTATVHLHASRSPGRHKYANADLHPHADVHADAEHESQSCRRPGPGRCGFRRFDQRQHLHHDSGRDDGRVGLGQQHALDDIGHVYRHELHSRRGWPDRRGLGFGPAQLGLHLYADLQQRRNPHATSATVHTCEHAGHRSTFFRRRHRRRLSVRRRPNPG